jgi:hypothetical protein
MAELYKRTRTGTLQCQATNSGFGSHQEIIPRAEPKRKDASRAFPQVLAQPSIMA